jgi:hypothetical protein
VLVDGSSAWMIPPTSSSGASQNMQHRHTAPVATARAEGGATWTSSPAKRQPEPTPERDAFYMQLLVAAGAVAADAAAGTPFRSCGHRVVLERAGLPARSAFHEYLPRHAEHDLYLVAPGTQQCRCAYGVKYVALVITRALTASDPEHVVGSVYMMLACVAAGARDGCEFACPWMADVDGAGWVKACTRSVSEPKLQPVYHYSIQPDGSQHHNNVLPADATAGDGRRNARDDDVRAVHSAYILPATAAGAVSSGGASHVPGIGSNALRPCTTHEQCVDRGAVDTAGTLNDKAAQASADVATVHQRLTNMHTSHGTQRAAVGSAACVPVCDPVTAQDMTTCAEAQKLGVQNPACSTTPANADAPGTQHGQVTASVLATTRDTGCSRLAICKASGKSKAVATLRVLGSLLSTRDFYGVDADRADMSAERRIETATVLTSRAKYTVMKTQRLTALQQAACWAAPPTGAVIRMRHFSNVTWTALETLVKELGMTLSAHDRDTTQYAAQLLARLEGAGLIRPVKQTPAPPIKPPSLNAGPARSINGCLLVDADNWAAYCGTGFHGHVMLALYRLLAEQSAALHMAIEAACATTELDALREQLVYYDDIRPPSAELVMKLAAHSAYVELNATRKQKGAVYVQLGSLNTQMQPGSLHCNQEQQRSQRGALGLLYFTETSGILCRDPPSANDVVRSRWPDKLCLPLQHELDVRVTACYVSVAARLTPPQAKVPIHMGCTLNAAHESACVEEMSKLFYDARAAWAEVLKQPVLDAVWAQLYYEHYHDVGMKAKICAACDHHHQAILRSGGCVKTETAHRATPAHAETVSSSRANAVCATTKKDKDMVLTSYAANNIGNGDMMTTMQHTCAHDTHGQLVTRARRDKSRRICESDDSLDTISEEHSPLPLRKRVRPATKAHEVLDFAESECTEDCVDHA